MFRTETHIQYPDRGVQRSAQGVADSAHDSGMAMFHGLVQESDRHGRHRTRWEHAGGCTSRLAGGAAPIGQSVCPAVVALRRRACAMRCCPRRSGRVYGSDRHGRAPHSKISREGLRARLAGGAAPIEWSVCLAAVALPAQGLRHVMLPPPKWALGRGGREGRFPRLWSAREGLSTSLCRRPRPPSGT